MKVVLAIFLLYLFPTTILSQSAPIQLKACGHHDYAPWNWKSDNEIQGACAKVTKALFAKVGAEVDLTYVGPWKRCLSYIKSGKVDINICSFVNEKRKNHSEFIMTPMGFNEQAVFVKKGSEFSFNTWDDLIDKKVGILFGVSMGEKFDTFLKKNTVIERVVSNKQNFEKLRLGRVDFIPMGRHSGLAILKQLDMHDEFVDLPTPILTGKLYISMSKKSPHLNLLAEVETLMQEQTYNQWVEELLTQYTITYSNESLKKMNDLFAYSACQVYFSPST